jgi:hypothetical protein
VPGKKYVKYHQLILFRLCLKPGLDEEKLKAHGYTSYLNYTMGYKDDYSSIGWGGRVQDKKDNPGMTLHGLSEE